MAMVAIGTKEEDMVYDDNRDDTLAHLVALDEEMHPSRVLECVLLATIAACVLVVVALVVVGAPW